ncbi:MAG: DUF1573 domain-containing protein [Bacteroidales bacterium]|nr:DUF1573 domain-containing protein [Bacteroidales bacterium]
MSLHRGILLSILVWFVAGAVASAQTTPVLRFEQKVFDFDTLSFQNGPIKAFFECTNISENPVQILEVRSYCRCLQVRCGKKLLQPGEKATVEAELSTERLNARQEHRFTVLASDGGEVMTNSLKLTGYVRRD